MELNGTCDMDNNNNSNSCIWLQTEFIRIIQTSGCSAGPTEGYVSGRPSQIPIPSNFEERLRLYEEAPAGYVQPQVFKHKRLCYALLIGGVATVGVLLASGLSALTVWILLSGGNAALLDTIRKGIFPSQLVRHFVVHSFADYKQIHLDSANSPYSLTLNLTEVTDWPESQIKINTNLIDLEIIGSITIQILVTVLSPISKLRQLSFRNPNGYLCRNNKDTTITNSLKISIDSLLIDGVSNDCKELTKIFSCLAITGLARIKVSKSHIDEESDKILVDVLRNNRGSLEEVTLNEIQLVTKHFKLDSIGVFPNVRSLTFDVRLVSESPYHLDSFAKYFPRLEKFSFGSLPRSMETANTLIGLLYLTQLEMNVSLASTSNYSVLFLHKEFPLLAKANIYLHYSDCTAEFGRYVLNLDELPENLLENLCINSNCKMLFDDQTV